MRLVFNIYTLYNGKQEGISNMNGKSFDFSAKMSNVLFVFAVNVFLFFFLLFYLPLRNLSPWFLLMANRPIVRLFLTLCMIAVAHFRWLLYCLSTVFMLSSLFIPETQRNKEIRLLFVFLTRACHKILLFYQALLMFMLRKEMQNN